MTRYAAFLRGVNVGGVNLKMAEVAAALDRSRVHQRPDHPRQRQRAARQQAGVDAVRKKAETALREAFGYDAWVLAYDVDDGRARSRRPTRSSARSRATTPTSRSSPTRRCSTNSPSSPTSAGPDEKIERGEGVVYWQVPKNGTLDTTIGKTMGKKRYKSSTTTRNLRTIDKVLAEVTSVDSQR